MAVTTNPNIPLVGTPGINNPINPTLLPNFDASVASGAGTVDHDSPQNFMIANPRVDATATITIGGSVTTADKLAITLANGLFSGTAYGSLNPALLAFEYTTIGGDTLSTVAEAFAGLINDNLFAQSLGIRADVAAAVVTVRHPGPAGNLSVLLGITGEPAKITITGTATTGDQINALFTGAILGPVAAATAEAIISGTSFVVGDTVALILTNASVAGLPITKTYTIVAGDNAASIGAGLRALVNADATLGAAGIQAVGANNVVTIRHQGVIGNSTVLTSSVTGTGNEAVAFLPSNGHLSGGTGQPGGVLVSFATTTGNSVTTMAAGLAAAITANPDLTALGVSAANVAGVINLTVPAAAQPLTISAFPNVTAPTVTVTGTSVAGDVSTLTFTNTAITGSPLAIAYTAVGADTPTIVAAGLVAAINANNAMKAAGISATNLAGVITLNIQQINGAITYAQSVVGSGSTSISVPANPTEVATLASLATETIAVTTFTGGSGPIIPINNFNWHHNSSQQAYWYGKPTLVDYPTLKEMVAQGAPIQ